MEEQSNPTSYIYNLNHLPKWSVNVEKKDTVIVKKTWPRLHKMEKIEKLHSFVEKYATDERLIEADKNELFTFLQHSLDRKRLQNSKDIIYNADTATIEKIPNLKAVHDGKRRFTLKKNDQCMKISKTILSRSKTMKKSLKNDSIGIGTVIESDGT